MNNKYATIIAHKKENFNEKKDLPQGYRIVHVLQGYSQ